MIYLQILTDIIGGYIALFIIIKCLGKTQISQITPFDFISALVLGEFVGSAIFDDKIGLLEIFFSILIWGGLIYLTELVTQKSRRLRMILEGGPSIIINGGQLDYKELKRNQLDIDQLQQLLRSKDIFSVGDVEYAILETNGGLSVLRKFEADHPTSKELQMKGEGKRKMPLTIISDGEVLVENLKKAGLDEVWLQKELQIRGINKHEEIFYAEWEPGEDLHIQHY